MIKPPIPDIPGWLWRFQGLMDPLESLNQWHQQYGDIFRLPQTSDVEMVCISSPQALQTVLTAPIDVISSNQTGSVFEMALGQNAMVFLEGDKHQRHRKLLMPSFHGERLSRWGTEIQQVTQRAIAPLRSRETFLVRPLMREIALRVILRVLVGSSPQPVLDELYPLLEHFFAALDSPLSALGMLFPQLRIDLGEWSPWGKFVRQKAQLNQIIELEIQRRQQTPQQVATDVLGLLLSTTDDQYHPLSLDEIRDELLLLVLSGYETTTSALGWALYWIHYSSLVDRTLAELSSTDSNPMEIARLPYLSAVCSESLRFHPIAIGCFGRRVLKPIVVDGYELEPGTWIHASIYLAHRRSSVYPNPLRFEPERFLQRQFSPYEFLPFGGGHRRCLGDAFVQFEMKLVIATILKSLALSLTTMTPLTPVRQGVSMAPPIDLQMRVDHVF